MQEVQALLSNGGIKRFPDSEIGTGCYSCYFLVLKKDGGLWPVLESSPYECLHKGGQIKNAHVGQVLSVGR